MMATGPIPRRNEETKDVCSKGWSSLFGLVASAKTQATTSQTE